MPLFEKGESKDKLLILYFARAVDIDITMEQLYRAMVENDCMLYFDFMGAVTELEEDGYIAAIPRTFGQGYRITQRGRETLGMFEDALLYSVKTRLSAYAENHREIMRRETQLVTSMEERDNGSYFVHLKAQELDKVIVDIGLPMPTREMAQRVRANWEKASEPIYLYLMEHLLK